VGGEVVSTFAGDCLLAFSADGLLGSLDPDFLLKEQEEIATALMIERAQANMRFTS
jgi:hypothetical protein